MTRCRTTDAFMIVSMTGFARRECNTQWGALAWELRTVNHRYLDISFRMPEEFRALEPKFRGRINTALGRGKVEATLRFSVQESTAGQELDTDAVARLSELESQVAGLVGGVRPLSTIEVLRWPGVLREAEHDSEQLSAAAEDLLIETLDELTRERAREGAAIQALIAGRLDGLVQQVTDVRASLPEIRSVIESRLRRRLADLDCSPRPVSNSLFRFRRRSEDRDIEVDSSRLEQELVIQLQKGDVDEELDRLDTHLDELRACLDATEPVGRRLDFLVQEANRETNTLGAKSQGLAVSKSVVEMKVLLEQIREQIQNCE